MANNPQNLFLWNVLKVVGRLVKYLVWIFCAVLVLSVILLYMAGQRIPETLVSRITDKLSSDKCSVRVDRASFSLRNGLHLYRPSVLYHSGPGSFERLLSADEVNVAISYRWPPRLKDLVKRVTVKSLRFPGIPKPPKDRPPEPPFRPDFPRLGVFQLVLEDPNILGIHSKRLEGLVEVGGHLAAIRDIAIQWHGTDCPAGMQGWVTADFATRLVTMRIRGEALPAYIVPLMDESVLDAPSVAEEMNAFQSVQPPMKVGADFLVNVDTCESSLFLTIDAQRCAYKGVPFEWIRGALSAGCTNDCTTLTVGPLEAKSNTGILKGRFTYREETESLDFQADSTMDFPQLFDIIGILNEGELDCIRCAQSPALTAAGVVSVEKGGGTTNRISGHVSMPEGSILNLKLKKVAGNFSMDGYTARFDGMTSETAHGGSLQGCIDFRFPGYDPERTEFMAELDLRDIDLADLAAAAHVTNDSPGEVSGHLLLRGKPHGNILGTLNGNGKIRIKNGLLNQMPIFIGFTDYLAKTVPGVAKLVNQSTGSMTFTINNGILSTDSLLIEGDVFSLSGKGAYDLQKDKLDFIVRANIFRKKTWVGKITRLVTFPFSRLLLEFHVFGSLQKPDWSYVDIIEKITTALGGGDDSSD